MHANRALSQNGVRRRGRAMDPVGVGVVVKLLAGAQTRLAAARRDPLAPDTESHAV